MNNRFRRIYNSIDSLFDYHAILQDIHNSENVSQVKSPKTARQAFENIQPFVHKLDRQARLKMIASQEGINTNGESSHWEFFFDLIERRAQLACDWSLPWNESTDNYSNAKIELTIKPFPPTESPIRQMIKDGKLLNRQLIGMWKQEYKRHPDLPYKFRDTNLILSDFSQQGLDITQTEFSLSTDPSPNGEICWVAKTRNKEYYAVFSE